MLAWFLVFLGMVIVDAVWAFYITAVSEKRIADAAGWSAVVIAVGGGVTLSYVKDPWLLIPACAGAYAGTWLSLYWRRELLDRG